MTDLTNSPAPEIIDPAVHRRLAGDWTDDDGLALDETFEPAFYGPVESESLAAEKESIPTPTRLLSSKVVVGTVDGVLYDPVQVFPVDLNRLKVIIQADDNVVVGSEKSDVYNGAAIVSPTQWAVDGHTGAVWVYSTEANAVNVVVWSVTK
jgi:hypothetical protein